MIDWLHQLEEEKEITILFACEAGSRAWGMDSATSDHDIRFIFRYKDLRRYLSINEPTEVIERSSPYDTVGWDIKKALGLLKKSNPSLYEWAFSPVIYFNHDDFAKKLQFFILESYSRYALFYHYQSLCLRNLKEVKGKVPFHHKRQKQLIHGLRSYLLARELVKSNDIDLTKLLNLGAVYTDEIGRLYEEMVEARRNQVLFSERQVNDIILLVEGECQGLLENSSTLSKGKDISQELNTWLWEILEVLK